MGHYIDADKLIAEIERREKIIRNCSNQISDSDKKTYYSGCADALLELRPIITSLQQEQPELSAEELDKLVAEEFASHSRTTEYGFEVTYNRAELYQLFKRMAIVFNAKKEDGHE